MRTPKPPRTDRRAPVPPVTVAARWQAADTEAIDDYNRHVEQHGVWSDGQRRF